MAIGRVALEGTRPGLVNLLHTIQEQVTQGTSWYCTQKPSLWPGGAGKCRRLLPTPRAALATAGTAQCRCQAPALQRGLPLADPWTAAQGQGKEEGLLPWRRHRPWRPTTPLLGLTSLPRGLGEA